MKNPIYLKSLSLILCLSLFAGTSSASEMNVQNIENYWEVQCDKNKGLLTYDRGNVLRRNTGVDALGVRIYKKEIQNNSDVVISGILYGRICEKIQLQDKVVYHWKNISIQNNDRIRPHLSTVTGFMSSKNFELKIEKDWYFEFRATSEQFLGSKNANKLARGQNLLDREFHIVFKIDYNEIENIQKNSLGSNPFVIFKYNLEAQNDGSVKFTN